MSDPFFSVIKIVKGSICSNTFYRRDDNGTNIKEAVCNDTACSYADHGSCSHDCVGGAGNGKLGDKRYSEQCDAE